MNNEKVLSRNKLNRMKFRGRNLGLKQYEARQLIEHYEEKYRLLKEVLNFKDQVIATFNNNVKLPKDVADWLVERNFTSILGLEVSLISILQDSDENNEVMNYLLANDEAITNIIDAYRYGWEIEEGK